MVFSMEHAKCLGITRCSSISTKIIFGFPIVIYFLASAVICNENIPFCQERLKALMDDVKDWEKRCVDSQGHDLATPHCKAEKRCNQDRMKLGRKMCFYKGNG